MLEHYMPARQFAQDADSVTSVERSDGPGWKRPMPRVSSMLFDLELEDGQEAGEDAAAPQISRQLLKLLQPRSQAEHQLGAAVNSAYETAAARGKRLSIDDLAEKLRGRGYDVRIRTALGGGGGGECLRNLRHHFLTLNMTGPDGIRVECIIDPSFAEQWGIARPTPAYANVVAALPQVYVGSSVELLVDFLCSELAAAFKAEGATLPPWRAADAMLSKWRPRRSVDCDMLAPPASAAAYPMARSPFASGFAGVGARVASRDVGNSLSRRSASCRPSKSQRISSSGRGSLHGSAGAGGGSFLGGAASSFRGGSSFLHGGSFLGGRPLALDKSVSKALSDAEAEEAAAADALDGFGDADASDSSTDSEAATLEALERCSGGFGSINDGGGGFGSIKSGGGGRRLGGRKGSRGELSTLSSSWRASDCMPFGDWPRKGCARTSLEGVSTSDGSDTTQGGPPPAPAPGLALQGRLISALPRLPSATAGAPFAATSPVSRSLSAPQPAARQPPAAAAAPMVVPEFGFAKPAPAKSALNFACKTSVGKLPDDVGQKSGRRMSEGAGGRRTVKCMPPLEASMTDLQTSFARGSNHGGGYISGAASGELAGTSPARRSHLARQQMGLPAVGDPAARWSPRPKHQQTGA